MYENPWSYQGRVVDTADTIGYIGFVYLITNLLNGKKYVGKKLLTRIKRTQKNKKIKRVKVESDWKNYYGSNKLLQEDVKTHGILNFKREILHLCLSKGTCNFFEAKEQFALDVLRDECYYNEWIIVKVHRSHIKEIKNGSF